MTHLLVGIAVVAAGVLLAVILLLGLVNTALFLALRNGIPRQPGAPVDD
jgi:hypothetical protein